MTIERMQRVIEAIVASCAAPTWEEPGGKLSRYFVWEYEDYVPPGAEDWAMGPGGV